MFEKSKLEWIRHIDFILIDGLCQQAAFALSYGLCFGLSSPYADRDYLTLAFVFALLTFFVSVAFDTFDGVLARGYYREFTSAMRHVFLVEGCAFVYLFGVQRGHIYSRVFAFSMIPLYIGTTYLGRLIWKKWVRKGRAGNSGKSIIVIAPRERMGPCIENISFLDQKDYSFVGAILMGEECGGSRIGKTPVVADYSAALNYIRREWVDEVFIDLSMEEGYPVKLIRQIKQMGVVLHIALTSRGSTMENAQQLERMGEYTVLTIGINGASPMQLWLKRLMDIAGGAVGCLITAVLFVIFALPIYISSPGPIFFCQERIGRNGKKFKLYKFRTMVPDAERQKEALLAGNRVEGGRMFKLDEDPRIIGLKRMPDGTVKKGIGSFLRETSLDEFPQMLNILRGDMSLVGIRPPTLDEWEQYEPHHRARMSFRPGLTGLWQISGRSAITDFEEVVRLDTKYIDDWNLGLDIKILLKTIGVVVSRRGAL